MLETLCIVHHDVCIYKSLPACHHRLFVSAFSQSPRDSSKILALVFSVKPTVAYRYIKKLAVLSFPFLMLFERMRWEITGIQ